MKTLVAATILLSSGALVLARQAPQTPTFRSEVDLSKSTPPSPTPSAMSSRT